MTPTSAQRVLLFVFVAAALGSRVNAGAPTVIGSSCTYKRVILHINESTPMTKTMMATYVRAYFDQPLYLGGSQSLEHIYGHGKLDAVHESLDGLLRLCCGGECLDSSAHGPVSSGTQDRVDVASFLTGPADALVHYNMPTLFQAYYGNPGEIPKANEVNVMFLSSTEEHSSIRHQECTLQVRHTNSIAHSLTNLRKEKVEPVKVSPQCKAHAVPTLNVVDHNGEFWNAFNYTNNKKEKKQTKQPKQSLSAAEMLSSLLQLDSLLKDDAPISGHKPDTVPVFFDEDHPGKFRDRGTVSWKQRGNGKLATADGYDSPAVFLQTSTGVRQIDPLTGLPMGALGDRSHMDLGEYPAGKAKGKAPAGGAKGSSGGPPKAGGASGAGNGPKRPIDPHTGKPVVGVPQIDPNTGKPIPGAPLVDPNTGKPLPGRKRKGRKKKGKKKKTPGIPRPQKVPRELQNVPAQDRPWLPTDVDPVTRLTWKTLGKPWPGNGRGNGGAGNRGPPPMKGDGDILKPNGLVKTEAGSGLPVGASGDYSGQGLKDKSDKNKKKGMTMEGSFDKNRKKGNNKMKGTIHLKEVPEQQISNKVTEMEGMGTGWQGKRWGKWDKIDKLLPGWKDNGYRPLHDFFRPDDQHFGKLANDGIDPDGVDAPEPKTSFPGTWDKAKRGFIKPTGDPEPDWPSGGSGWRSGGAWKPGTGLGKKEPSGGKPGNPTGKASKVSTPDPFRIWCDLRWLLGNPFCPFPIPFLIMINFYIKSLVPAVIGPVIDILAAEFMAGQEAPLMLVDNMLLQLNQTETVTPTASGLPETEMTPHTPNPFLSLLAEEAVDKSKPPGQQGGKAAGLPKPKTRAEHVAAGTLRITPRFNPDAPVHPFPSIFRHADKMTVVSLDRSSPDKGGGEGGKGKETSAGVHKIFGDLTPHLFRSPERRPPEDIPQRSEFTRWKAHDAHWAKLDDELTNEFRRRGIADMHNLDPWAKEVMKRQFLDPDHPRHPKHAAGGENHVPLRIVFDEERTQLLYGSRRLGHHGGSPERQALNHRVSVARQQARAKALGIDMAGTMKVDDPAEKKESDAPAGNSSPAHPLSVAGKERAKYPPPGFFVRSRFQRVGKGAPKGKKKPKTPDNSVKKNRIKAPPAGKGGGGTGMALIPLLKKGLYTALAHPLTLILSDVLTREISLYAVPPLFDKLNDDLRDFLRIGITHSLTHTITNTLPLTLGVTIPEVLESVMPIHLILEMTSSMSNTVTRSLTHALSLTLVQTLGKSALGEYYCYFCFEYKQFCDKCQAQGAGQEDVYASLYYAEWLGSYYSDYYAPYYAWGVFALLKKHPEAPKDF